MQYKITIKNKKEDKKEFIYGGEKPEEIIRKFLSTLDTEIGLKIKEIEYIKLEEI